MTRDPLAPFDDSVLAAVARDHGVTVGTLRDLVRRHQELVRRLPGVDDLVYEWRRGFPNDPVVERRSEAYFLSVADTVWPEYVSTLSLDEREAAALRAVHRRQLESSVGDRPTGDRGAMVLARE
jgi:transposase-like protein